LSFAFKDQAKKTCQWIQTPGKEKRRQKLCLYDDVRAACPNTCGLCCGDDPETEFGWSSKKGWTTETCDWLTANPNKTETRLKKCDTTTAKKICLLSCDACFEEVVKE